MPDILELPVQRLCCIVENSPAVEGTRRYRAAKPIAHEQISVLIDGRSIVEAYTKRRSLHDLVIRHPQDFLILVQPGHERLCAKAKP